MPPGRESFDTDLVEAIARRVADLIREQVPSREPPERIDAAEVARRLGVHRATVYRNPRRFGGEKISDGPKGRWRFDPAKIHGGGMPSAADEGPKARVRRRRGGRKTAPEGELKIRGRKP
jgi:hypothetical protein